MDKLQSNFQTKHRISTQTMSVINCNVQHLNNKNKIVSKNLMIQNKSFEDGESILDISNDPMTADQIIQVNNYKTIFVQPPASEDFYFTLSDGLFDGQTVQLLFTGTSNFASIFAIPDQFDANLYAGQMAIFTWFKGKWYLDTGY